MNAPELALHHQRLDQRAASLRGQIARIQAAMASDPEAERLEAEATAVHSQRRDVELGLREREREADAQRTRLRGRERELMSGRIRNPTELMKLNEEVEHLRSTASREEDAALELMDRQERLEADLERLGRELAAARERTAAAAPELRGRLERLERELQEVEAERDATWEQVQPEWQEAYRRVHSRQPDPVAHVVGGQCQACRVAVTSSGMQTLRRAGLLYCDNCGRILVVA
ncbi:MAG TPA: C4-type zinc ribbon domain-containing protein [Candidatus Dormibacteraeota bacterium]|nr:C4-type zinc ribbon domain-containing protein [Candidatus Dormibacteraeota bacterium]